MRILISADIEGVAGVIHSVQLVPADVATKSGRPISPDYQWARQLLAQEVNAAIEGAFEGGADDVIVNEGHDGMRNIIPTELDPRARLINGYLKPFAMMQGIDMGIDAAFFVGYHAAANTRGAVIAHTYQGTVSNLRINGIRMGETGGNATLAGYFNVPVVFISGDDKVVKEAHALLGEDLIGVAVKEGISANAAIHMHPDRAREAIYIGARQAMGLAGKAKSYQVTSPVRVEVDWLNASMADYVMRLPGAIRAGDRTTAYIAKNALEAHQIFRLMLPMAAEAN
jgi:D-amino peptidase